MYRTFTHSRTISRHAYPVTESTYPAIVNATDLVNRVAYPVTRHACNTRLPAVTQSTHTVTRPLTQSTDPLNQLQGALILNVDPCNGHLPSYWLGQRRRLPGNKGRLSCTLTRSTRASKSCLLPRLTGSTDTLTGLLTLSTDLLTRLRGAHTLNVDLLD